MWSSDLTRRGVLAGLLALGGCGFQPVHGSGGLVGKVRIDTGGTNDTFDVNARLMERFGPETDPRWALSYELAVGQEAFNASTATRTQIHGELSYVLDPLVPDARRVAGRVSGFAGFTEGLNTPTDTSALISTSAAARDARRRLMVVLADRAVNDMRIRLNRSGA